MTVDQFWIAVLKTFPYEITSAYGLILTGYLASRDSGAVDYLFFAVVALTLFVFILNRSAGATWATSLASSVLFFLVSLVMQADAFHNWFIDKTIALPPLPNLLDALVRPFPLLVAAVLIVLVTASLRTILGKPPTK